MKYTKDPAISFPDLRKITTSIFPHAKMLPQSLFLLVSAFSLAAAGPVRRRCGGNKPNTTTPAPEATSPTTVTPVLPDNPEVSPQLPAPLGPFKHIVVGHGLQNYSCSAPNVTAKSGGALAVLYDIMDLYPGSSANALSEEAWADLPRKVLYETELPLNIVGNQVNQYAADVNGPFKPEDAPLAIEGKMLNVLGHHYFDDVLVPTFDLFAVNGLLKAKKLASIKAPTKADKGLLQTGAVDWLDLDDAGGSMGVQQVYRVITSGGGPIECTSTGETFSVPYTAMYWFT